VTEAQPHRPGNCFMALPLEGDSLAAAGALLDAAAAAVENVRWARPEGLHLTLHFFGRLGEEQHAGVLALLAPVAAATPPMELQLGGLGRFPPRGPARVLWAGLATGGSEVVRLADACRTALATAGFAVDARPHHPHITLGRPRRWSAVQGRAWEALQPPEHPPWHAGRLLLLESRSAPGGNRYVPRGQLPLAGSRPPG
jgi:2'-5' RNA ligase